MRHLTDEQFLEAHFLDSAGPIEEHLAHCTACRKQFELISSRFELAARAGMESFEAKPDTFWARQRFAIRRRIEEQRREPASPIRPSVRWVAAVASIMLLGSFLLYRISLSERVSTETAIVAASPTPHSAAPANDVLEGVGRLGDPWESEALQSFGDAVQWETWAADTKPQMENTL